MNFHPRLAWVSVVVALAALQGCGDGGDGGGAGAGGNAGSGGNAAAGGAGGGTLPEFGSFDRAGVSYADNLLQKVQDGEWTLGEGLVATLRLFAGELEEADVLRETELTNYEGTGVFWMARDYLVDGPDAEAQMEIDRLLGLLDFTISELEEMAGLVPTSPALQVPKQAAENCGKYFKDFEDPPMGVTICLEVESVMISGKEHRIFFPAPPLPTAGWDETSISLAVDALADSIPVYEAVGSVPEISIVYSVADAGPLWGQSFPDGNGECYIAIYTGLQGKIQEDFQQLLAHEIAHCFQVETWTSQHMIGYDTIKWHFEGAAEYWSNLVYPATNLEWDQLPKLFQNELVSTIHNRSYENFAFFQYLGNVIGSEGLDTLIRGLPDDPTTNIVDQREGLADYPNMEQLFHDYTQALTDGVIQDSSGELIPYAAPAYDVGIFGPAVGAITVPLMFPFATYRFLVSTDDDEQAELAFREGGSPTSSARRSSEGVATELTGIVTESVLAPGFTPWSPSLPSELPEEECESGARMVVATTSASPTEVDGLLSGPSFDMDVTDVDGISCCLHGQWVMNNQDLGTSDSQGLGVPVTYTGQLTADYGSDGTVLFVWGGLTRVIEDVTSSSTSVITGGGAQFYDVPSDDVLRYGPPELTVDVTETSSSGQSTSFTAVLDTGLGDLQTTQFFECTEDMLVTVIRGDDEIRWQRQAE
ncbi:MAG: DUF6055 domain-containing protein [Myxococcota bacterium]